MAVNFPSSATLTGARQVNFLGRAARQEDLGYKIERLISAVNALGSSVSQIQVALGSAASLASQFSAFSAWAGNASPGAVSTLGSISNFRS